MSLCSQPLALFVLAAVAPVQPASLAAHVDRKDLAGQECVDKPTDAAWDVSALAWLIASGTVPNLVQE